VVTRAEHVKLIVGLLLSIASCFQIHRAILAFSNISTALPSALPAYKQFLIAYHPILYFFPVFILATWFMPKWRGRAGTLALATGISIFICLLLFLAVFSWPLSPKLTAA